MIYKILVVALFLLQNLLCAQLDDSIDIHMKFTTAKETKEYKMKQDRNVINGMQSENIIPSSFRYEKKYYIQNGIIMEFNEQKSIANYLYFSFSPNVVFTKKKSTYTFDNNSLKENKWFFLYKYEYDSLGNMLKYYSNAINESIVKIHSFKKDVLTFTVKGTMNAYNSNGTQIPNDTLPFSASISCRYFPFKSEIVQSYLQKSSKQTTAPLYNLTKDETLLNSILIGNESATKFNAISKIFKKNKNKKNNLSLLSAAILLNYFPTESKLTDSYKLTLCDFLQQNNTKEPKPYSQYYTDAYYIDNFKTSIDFVSIYMKNKQFDKALAILKFKFPESNVNCNVFNNENFLECYLQLHQDENLWKYMLRHGLFLESKNLNENYKQKLAYIISQKFTIQQRNQFMEEIEIQLQSMKSDKYIGKIPKIEFQGNSYSLCLDNINSFTFTYNDLPEIFKKTAFYVFIKP